MPGVHCVISTIRLFRKRGAPPEKLHMFGRNVYVVLCAVALAVSMISNAQAENRVRLNTLDWEPYIGRELPDSGFVAAIVNEAYAASGYTVELEFMPWVRAKAMAREGRSDGCMPEYYLAEDKTDFLVSDPFPGGPLVFFKRKADTIVSAGLEDLRSLKIGVVRGYVNTEEFDMADYLNKEEANDDIINLRKLAGGRLDLIVIDKFVGLYLLKKEMPDKVEDIEVVVPALEEKNLHVLISRKVPAAEAKMKAFNDGLRKLKESGRLDVLLKSNGW